MIIQDDVIHWAETYEGEPFHAMLLDPPYHLTSITKRFGKDNSAPAKFGKDGAFSRASAGFMGQQWDGGDLAFRPETWAALAQHLYPGAFIMAFASSRGWHRMAVAMEDAGLILHPSLWLYWNYLSGFPKATRIDTQIQPKNEQAIIGINPRTGKESGRYGAYRGNHEETTPTDDLAQTWAGHRYGGQMIKPAIEPIIVAQVPYAGRPVENIVETGAGALWIDGGRIPTNDGYEEQWNKPIITNISARSQNYGQGAGHNHNIDLSNYKPSGGRWPSNLILHCSCPPDRPDKSIHDDTCAVAVLDGQSGEIKSGSLKNRTVRYKGDNGTKWTQIKQDYPVDYEANSGPASRMFYQSSWAYEVAEQLAAADSIRYEPKASSNEREIGLDSLETQTRHRVNAGGLENESRFAPTQVKNIHPTIKPLSLAIYLSRLLAPPKEYAPRRLLIPFAGAGSEVCGAILSGQWEEIIGIEKEENYVRIAQERVKFWESMKEKVQIYGLDAILQKYIKKEKIPEEQLSLFNF